MRTDHGRHVLPVKMLRATFPYAFTPPKPFTLHLHHCILHTARALFLLPYTTSALSTCCHA